MRIKMKRFLGILLTLTLVLGLMPGMSMTAYADSETIVTYDLSVDGKSINKDGVTCTESFDTYNNITVGGIFSTSSGTFSRIVVNASDVDEIGEDRDHNLIAGWSSNNSLATWTGNSSSVQFGAIRGNIDNVTITFTIAPDHTHNYTYSSNGATITATCGAAGCDLTDSKATLTIVKPTLETYLQTGAGISAAATLTGLEAFKTATGLTVTADSIKYFKATKSGSTYTKDGTALAAAPTYAGDYFAEITLSGVKTGAETTGDVAASVGYTIAKAEITITTAPAAGEITYGQTLEDSTLTGGVVSEKDDSRVSVEGTFAWKDSTVVPTVSDSQKTEYDVVFTPKNTNYATAECKLS